MQGITINIIADREGQILHNALLSHFTPYENTHSKTYRLQVHLSFTENNFAFRRDATARRFQVTIKAPFELINTQNNTVVYRDEVNCDTSYSLGSTANTAALPKIVSDGDAKLRALQQISHEIKLLISSYLHTHPQTMP